MTMTSPSKIDCAENDPGSAGYVRNATSQQRAEFSARSRIDPVYAAHHAPDFDDVMIDIETMSLHPHNALILSVGMIEFDPSGLYNEGPGISDLKIGARSLILPNIEQQLLMGREVSKSTQD